MKKLFNWKISFIILLILTAFLRLYQLGQVPYGVANDEMSYIYSSYTVLATGGYDIVGKFLPLSINVDSSLSPVPVYLMVPFLKLLGSSIPSARLLFALTGMGSVILVFLITKKIFNNKLIAFLSAFVLAVSPWHLLISRGAWDGSLAMFFYLMAIYIFIIKVDKGNINWSLPIFLLAFYSYHGTKVFFVFLIPLLIFIFKDLLLKRKKEILLFVSGIILILTSFLFVIATQNANRQDEIFFSNKKYLIETKKEIDFERAKSDSPFILKTIFSNKLINYSRTITENYLGAFSPKYLFTVGDINPITGYGTFFKGAMYPIDLLLLILGLAFLLKFKKNRYGYFVILSLLISPIPSALVPSKTYLIRSVMMLPFLSIIAGCGIYYFLNLSQKYNNNLRNMVLIILIAFYSFFVARYLYQYYFQFNTYGTEYWNGSNRKLTEFLVKNNNYKNIYIVGAEDKFFLQYGFFAKVEPLVMRKIWNTDKNKWPKQIDNISFINNCFSDGKIDPMNLLTKGTLYITRDNCHKQFKTPLEIIDPIDGRTIWKIYEKN